MFPTVSLGPLVIPTAPFTLILGVWLMVAVTEWVSRPRSHLPTSLPTPNQLSTLLTTALLVTALAARLAFVAQHWSAYRYNLWGIVWPITTGYFWWAGVPFGLFAALLYARRQQLPLWPTLDGLAPGLLVGLMALSLADFLGGRGMGKETDLFWAVNLFGVWRHPVQWYEMAAWATGLMVWAWRWRQGRLGQGDGVLSGAAAAAAGYLFINAYHQTTPLTQQGYHIGQFVAFAIMLLSLFLLTNRPALRHNTPS